MDSPEILRNGEPSGRCVQSELLTAGTGELPVTADGLLTVEEAAEFLRLGRNSIYNAMAAGELPFCKFGRSRRIPRRALIDYAAARLAGGWAIQPHRACVNESQTKAHLQVAT